MSLIIPSTQTLASGDFDIPYSCRFNDDDSPKLTRAAWTASAASQRIWTYSVWFKLSSFDDARDFFQCGGHDECMMSNSPANTIDWYTENTTGRRITTQVFRDSNAWYHAVFRMDTTDGTPADRMQLFINGTRVTDFSTSSDPTLNHQTKLGGGGSEFVIGSNYSANYWDGYMADIHFVDGIALNADSFGEFGDFGEWKPIKFSGSHGTYGFYLDFSDSAALGDDAAGSNDSTVTNITASDQMLDTPTNNFATFNYLDQRVGNTTLAEGSLKRTGISYFNGGSNGSLRTTNKIYYEVNIAARANNYFMFGFSPDNYSQSYFYQNASTDMPGKNGWHGVTLSPDYGGILYDGSTTQTTSATFDVGDVFMFAFDPATGKFWWGENGTWAGSGNPATGANPAVTLTNLDHTWTACAGGYSTGNTIIINCGQDGTFAGNKTAGGNADDNDYGNFLYDVPAGFLALCSKNLTDCAVTPSEEFNTKIYTQTGSTNDGDDVVVSTKACDLIWIKDRDSASYNHVWLDRIRGGDKYLAPNTAEMEGTMAGGTSAGITYGTDTYTIGNDANAKGINSNSGADYVAWSWRADGTTGLSSPDTEGTINATASSVNTDAGFSITQYSGNSTSGATIGHGLSVRPDLVLIKRLNGDNTKGWPVGSIQTLASWPSFSHHMRLNTDVALAAEVAFFNDTNPTATVVSLGNGTWTNETGGVYMMYCWHNIADYSKIGSFRGNGTAADGSFIYTGFSPAFIMLKRIDAAGKNWHVLDKARDPMNDGNQRNLKANLADVEDGGSLIDFLSNGFKTYTANSEYNYGGGYYLYLAFADVPFKNSNAV